ncbi:ectoine/hydroxyectoine ABC transporter permease subunit EhuC [Sodalis sp. RH21]|uniref:ectoine/hydroxyectoine ABC transporter permease subunit EhuC n=1 Tax=unclassified Sodalis (in: enterobacteria) TaxID=2636512 RepID=UPI0039B48E25
MNTDNLGFIVHELAKGIGVTLQITFLSAALALALAFIVALLRLSPLRPVSAAARVYIEFLRGTSALVQLFYLFFILPLFGISLSPMTTAVIGLGLNFSSFGAEIVRTALVNVSQGQRDALRALDFPPAVALRRIILPQALPFMLPPLGNLLVELLKSTSLVSMITLSDLTFSGATLITTLGHQTLIWSIVLAAYFILSWPLTLAVRRYERHHTRHRGLQE